MNFPDVVRIESSGVCNFRCRHCPTSHRPTGRGLMLDETFNLLLEQFAKKSFVPRVAVMYHGGEPLLNTQLPKMLATLKDLGVQKTVLTTNCSLLTPNIAHELPHDILDEMQVSFDGCSPEENDFILFYSYE